MPKILRNFLLISSLLVTLNVESVPSEKAFIPLPESPPVMEGHTLGKALFKDKRLSSNHDISCQTCHQPDHAFSGQMDNDLDIPSLLNVIYMDSFFWDGRSKDLEEALDSHIQSDIMGQTPQALLTRLQADPDLVASFNEIFKDGLTYSNVIHALRAYLGTLTTPNASFDAYIKGNASALTEAQKKGYDLFVTSGCASCHQGINIGGNLTQKMGIYHDYFEDPMPKDLGLYHLTGNNKDKYVFRVPSLRNVAKTAPYFHDGSAQSLEEAITIMAKYQLNRDFFEDEIVNLKAFLESLTGQEPQA